MKTVKTAAPVLMVLRAAAAADAARGDGSRCGKTGGPAGMNRDKREDVRDRKEDRRDKCEDIRDRREDRRDAADGDIGMMSSSF